MSRHGALDETSGCFRHATLFYAGEDGFLRGTLPFISEAVAGEEPILVAVGARKIQLLKEALGATADDVHFADMRVLGSNPARIIPAWWEFLAEHAPDGSPVRGVGEPIWAGRSDAELTECQRHESLLNMAFDGGQGWQLLCPYDLDALDEGVIAEARRSHPFLEQEGASQASHGYLHAHEASGPFDGALPVPTTDTRELAFAGVEQLGSLRSFVSQEATSASLGAGRTEDLVLAVSELATNSLCHGGGEGTVRIWTEADTLMCEVHDGGHIVEPLAGRIFPTPDQYTGRGLWVVNHLCDLVQIRSTTAGSVVRMHMRLG